MTCQVITRYVPYNLRHYIPHPVVRDLILIASRWYRPPELLFGSRYYSPAVDIWSIGTILVELVLRVPFLSGDTDADQLKKTYHAMGTPTEEDWPVCGSRIQSTRPPESAPLADILQGHKQLPDYHIVGDYPKNPWWNHVSSIGKDGQDVTREMLRFDPQSRVSARQASHESLSQRTSG